MTVVGLDIGYSKRRGGMCVQNIYNLMLPAVGVFFLPRSLSLSPTLNLPRIPSLAKWETHVIYGVMANINYIQVPRDRERQNRKTTAWLWYLPVIGTATLVGGVVAGCIAVLFGAIVLGCPSIGAVRQSGVAGEEALMRELMSLPDHYTVLNQILIPNPRSRTGTTEIDFIVISPGRLFVLEAKNHRGFIEGGDERASAWRVRKVGRGGTPYTTPMRNPVRQAKTQALALSEWLCRQGIEARVSPIVVLTHPRAEWRPLSRYSIPIVRLREVNRLIEAAAEGNSASVDTGRIAKALQPLLSDSQPSTK